MQASYAATIAACVGFALIALERWKPNAPGLPFVQAALLLAGLSLAIYVLALRMAKIDFPAMVLFHLLCGILIVHSSSVLIQFWKYVTSRVPYTWTEQVIFLSATQSDGVLGLYSLSNLSNPPILTSVYPPVYYVVLKLSFLFFGKSIVIGRYVSVAALLLIAVLVGLASQRRDGPIWSLPAPLLFLATLPSMTLGGSLAKPEFLAAGLSFAGLLIYLKRGLVEGKSWILYSSLLCGLALLSKPSLAAGIGAIVIHLLYDRRYKECLRFASSVLLWFSGVYAALWVPTQGGIGFMTFVANAAKFTPLKIIDLGIEKYMASVFVLVALAACTVLLSGSRGSRQGQVVAAFYFLIALSWFVVSVGRPGSSYNYFLEAGVAGSLVIGILISQLASERNWVALRLVLVVLVVNMLIGVRSQMLRTSQAYDDVEEQATIMKVLGDLETRHDEYVLSDVIYTSDVVQAGHRPVLYDSYIYTLMRDNGAISIEPLMSELRREKVPYLVLQNTLEWHRNLPYGGRYWPVSVLEYLNENYTCRTALKRKTITWASLVICERIGLNKRHSKP